SGIQIIIFLSGLQTISASMFEAAKIEGATAWETFWKITFPMVSSLILVNVIYSIIDFFVRSDNEVMNHIKQTMTPALEYGRSSAMAWSYFAVIAVIIAIVSATISKRVYYYD
ncbi:MAG: ABC transporter permease subunit, partial [Herbinix sp.]|nr:ABC transporter permease subunit [Herbinix sp.]